MIGPRPCSYACAYVDPVFTSQSYDISISISTRRTNLSVFLVLMLMLMSTQFSLAYTSACAYVLAKTRLKRESTITDVFSKANENSAFSELYGYWGGEGVSPVFISPMVPRNDIFRSSLVDLLLTSAERNGVKRERAYSLLTGRLQYCNQFSLSSNKRRIFWLACATDICETAPKFLYRGPQRCTRIWVRVMIGLLRNPLSIYQSHFR